MNIVVHRIVMSWEFVLLPATVPEKSDQLAAMRVAGLSLPLRAALAAQAGGACCVRLAPGTESVRSLLNDDRLKIPVQLGGPSGEHDLVVRQPWNVVTHRDVPKLIAENHERGTVDLPEDAIIPATPYTFEPVEVVDRASASKAVKGLFYSLRKPQDGWTSTYLNRYISLTISRFLVRTPLRPNQLSVAILAVGLVGAYLASRGTYLTVLLGALLFQVQSVLDGCDGEISRVTYRGSHLGQWLDTVGDDLTNYSFFVGASWGMYRASGVWWYLLVGGVILVSGLLASGLEYRYLVSIGSGDLLKYPLGVGKAPSTTDIEKGGLARAVDAISPLFKRDSFVFLTLLAAALGQIGPMLVVFALGGVGILVAVVKAELRMARERRERNAP